MGRRGEDMVGQRFGAWLVLQDLPPSGHHRVCLCRCDCGLERGVILDTLRYRKSKSCRACSYAARRTFDQVAYTREYYRQHRVEIDARRKKWRAVNPDMVTKQTKRREEKYPEKHLARRLLSQAIRSGRIVRQPCRVCGASPADGHHPDYSKPLEVDWLCRQHRSEEHNQGRAA